MSGYLKQLSLAVKQPSAKVTARWSRPRTGASSSAVWLTEDMLTSIIYAIAILPLCGLLWGDLLRPF